MITTSPQVPRHGLELTAENVRSRELVGSGRASRRLVSFSLFSISSISNTCTVFMNKSFLFADITLVMDFPKIIIQSIVEFREADIYITK